MLAFVQLFAGIARSFAPGIVHDLRRNALRIVLLRYLDLGADIALCGNLCNIRGARLLCACFYETLNDLTVDCIPRKFLTSRCFLSQVEQGAVGEQIKTNCRRKAI